MSKKSFDIVWKFLNLYDEMFYSYVLVFDGVSLGLMGSNVIFLLPLDSVAKVKGWSKAHPFHPTLLRSIL